MSSESVRSETPGTAPLLLTRAAHSIAVSQTQASGRAHTIVDVLHGRAMRHYAEGLRQYLAIRLGGTEAAERALQGVRAVVAARSSEALVQPPGIRAHLYRIARSVALRADTSLDLGALPWRKARNTRRQSRLQALRAGLQDRDAELLELRHARELRPVEIAFVLDCEVEKVLEDLERATERAARLLDKERGEHLRRLLLEAFALEGLTPTLQSGALPSEVEALQPGAKIAGRYRIQARVGTGAFGDVYRAEDDEVPGHVVALKLLHQPSYSESAKQSALRELRHIASVFHPSVVQFKDHGWHDGRLWFVMPWYDGETLESRLVRGPLSRAEARRIFEPLARALAAIHAAGIRHQDIKPDNIFLAEIPGFGREEVLPVLIDLGVSATEAEMLVAGTPTYFAPEVAAQFASVKRKPRVNAKADVFSLALALRNALEPETQVDVPAGAVESFVESRARELPEMPMAKHLRFLEPTLERWMAFDANERPSAEELAEELAVLTSPEENRARRNRFLRWFVPIVIVLGAAATGGVAHFHARAAQQRLEAENARLAERSVRQDLQRSERRRIGVEADAARLQRSRSELEVELAATETALGQTERALDQLESRHAALESRAEELAESKVTLEARAAELEAEIATKQANLEAQQAQVASLEEQLAALQVAGDELRASRDVLAAERDDERAARHRAEARAAAMQDELGDARTRVATLHARVAAADARADALETQLARALRPSPATPEPEPESSPEAR